MQYCNTQLYAKFSFPKLFYSMKIEYLRVTCKPKMLLKRRIFLNIGFGDESEKFQLCNVSNVFIAKPRDAAFS